MSHGDNPMALFKIFISIQTRLLYKVLLKPILVKVC